MHPEALLKAPSNESFLYQDRRFNPRPEIRPRAAEPAPNSEEDTELACAVTELGVNDSCTSSSIRRAFKACRSCWRTCHILPSDLFMCCLRLPPHSLRWQPAALQCCTPRHSAAVHCGSLSNLPSRCPRAIALAPKLRGIRMMIDCPEDVARNGAMNH